NKEKARHAEATWRSCETWIYERRSRCDEFRAVSHGDCREGGPMNWKRCSRDFPCPLCNDTKQRCTVSSDGKFCVCFHVAEGAIRAVKAGMGHLHALDGKITKRLKASGFKCDDKSDKLTITEVRAMLEHH